MPTAPRRSPLLDQTSPGAARHRGGDPVAHADDGTLARSRRGRRRAGGLGARHATVAGDRFGSLLAWTTAGAALPGLAFLGAGRRATAGVLLTLTLLGTAAAAGAVVAVGPGGAARWVGTRPDALLAAAVVALAVGVAWCVVVVAGHVALRRRRRLTGGQQALAAALVAVLVTLVALPSATAARYALAARSAVLTVFNDSDLPREGGLAGPDVSASDPWAGTPRINVLLLGSDAGRGRIGVRPDTIVVASIDTETGDTVLFSLPRNLEKAPFPPGTPGARRFPDGFDCSGSQCILNAVWTWGEANPQAFPDSDQPGLAATRQVVGETLGLQIDYYAMVNLRGFEEVVDALGGITIDVERRLPIGGGTNLVTGQSNPVNGYIQPGTQVLDGYEALWYARSRSDSSDYERMRRQRCVLAAVVDQADPSSLAMAFPKLAASAERNVETDITAAELDAFVELGMRVQDGTMTSLPFTNDVINSGDADFGAIRALVQKAINPPEPTGGATAGGGDGAGGDGAGGAAGAQPAPATAPDAIPDAEQSQRIDPPRAVNVDQVCG